ncbi:MerR family transcriptional regulator [Zavarzinia sp. CC-PAN008]|uniref:MerR family transcriptional regulator n=1 Tax=Zavarzinia sp. CC-PAN008 TaxID=3243332 RepID=UPI003F743183
MKELERRTGIGRETIRFYIREGLLPEPDRPKANVAVYDDGHVRRLQMIRRLQQERYLPLSLIKVLMEAPQTPEPLSSIPELDVNLAARMGLAPRHDHVGLAEAVRIAGLSEADLRVLAECGVVRLVDGPDGAGISSFDVAIARLWGRAKVAGYDERNGFDPTVTKLYVDVIEAMAEREIDQFYGRVAGKLGGDSVAALGQVGIEVVNDLIALLRTRALLERVAAVNRAQEAATRSPAPAPTSAPAPAPDAAAPARRRTRKSPAA